MVKKSGFSFEDDLDLPEVNKGQVDQFAKGSKDTTVRPVSSAPKSSDAPRVAVAPKPEKPAKKAPTLPWQAEGVRADVVKSFLLRLPEPLMLKLTWVAERSPKSKHALCLAAVEKALDREIAKLAKAPKDDETA